MTGAVSIRPDSFAQGDLILPIQFYENAGAHGLSCEQRLLLAVLVDVINILQNPHYNGPARKKQLYLEARKWVFENSDERIFSFDYICDALGLDVDATRSRLGILTNEAGHPTGSRSHSIRLRLKESSRVQHLTPNRVRVRQRRSRIQRGRHRRAL